MIAFSGVRSSCDMLARNSDLWWLATSSWRLLSWISWNRRAFWIAITAWSAKVFSRPISLSVNGRTSARMTRDRADAAPLAASARTRAERLPDRLAQLRAGRSACRRQSRSVGYVHGAMLAHRRAAGRCVQAGCGNDAGHRLRARRRGARRHGAAPSSPPARCPRCADLRTAAGSCPDLLEHRRGVGHRAADHAQHLGRRGLLLERLLGLVEQAHVLDRDHRLVGEGLEQVATAAAASCRGRATATTMTPIGAPSFSIGAPIMRRHCADMRRGLVVVRVGLGVFLGQRPGRPGWPGR